MVMHDFSDYLTDAEAADLAGVGRRAITRARLEGRIVSYEFKGRYLLRRSDVLAYAAEQGQRNGARAKKGEQPAKRRRPAP